MNDRGAAARRRARLSDLGAEALVSQPSETGIKESADPL
jgi:hypothetical protein